MAQQRLYIDEIYEGSGRFLGLELRLGEKSYSVHRFSSRLSLGGFYEKEGMPIKRLPVLLQPTVDGSTNSLQDVFVEAMIQEYKANDEEFTEKDAQTVRGEAAERFNKDEDLALLMRAACRAMSTIAADAVVRADLYKGALLEISAAVRQQLGDAIINPILQKVNL